MKRATWARAFRSAAACVAENSGAQGPMIAVGGSAELHDTLRYIQIHLGELQGLKRMHRCARVPQSGFRVE